MTDGRDFVFPLEEGIVSGADWKSKICSQVDSRGVGNQSLGFWGGND